MMKHQQEFHANGYFYQVLHYLKLLHILWDSLDEVIIIHGQGGLKIKQTWTIQ